MYYVRLNRTYWKFENLSYEQAVWRYWCEVFGGYAVIVEMGYRDPCSIRYFDHLRWLHPRYYRALNP
jgi:hypothetical protein